jgi:hypothetical protein
MLRMISNPGRFKSGRIISWGEPPSPGPFLAGITTPNPIEEDSPRGRRRVGGNHLNSRGPHGPANLAQPLTSNG